MATMPAATSQGELAFEPKVDVDRKSRPHPAEMACGGAFYLLFLVQIILGIVVLSSQNTSVVVTESEGDNFISTCPEGFMPAYDCCFGYVYNSLDCVSADLCAEMQSCSDLCRSRRLDGGNTTSAHAQDLRKLAGEMGDASPRRLHMRAAAARYLSSQRPVAENLWAFFEEHFYLPTTLFLCLFALAGLWLVLLLKAATPVIWGVIVLDILMLIAVFLYFLVEFEEVCYPALIFAVVGSVGAGVFYKKINNAGRVLTEAMNALSANKRLFIVAFGVKIFWGAYFGFWIASMISMFFYKTVGINSETGHCELQDGHPGVYHVVWLVSYYWSMYFFQNLILCVMTMQIGGWYFRQENSSSLWIRGLQVSLTKLAGGNAICAAILGATAYFKNLLNSKIRFVAAILNPVDWIPLCFACCLKQCVETYTKFGMIGQAFAGGNFCENAQKTVKLLKSRLGEAVLTDFLGQRVMSWATYILCVGVMFGALAWAEDLHDIGIIAEIGLWGNFFLLLGLAGFIARPFLSLVLIIFIETYVGSAIAGSDEIRSVFNIIFAALFCGSVAMFIMKFVSLVVCDAMNIIFFCFAVEVDSGKEQERFRDLYEIIKKSVVTGAMPDGTAVSASSPVTTTIQVAVPDGAQPGAVIQTQGPSGPVQVTVPEGATPGSIIQVAVPAAPQPLSPPSAANAEPAVAVVGNPMKPEENIKSQEVLV